MFTTTSIYSSFLNLLVDQEFDKYGGLVKPWSTIPILCIVIGLVFVGVFYVLGKHLSKKEDGKKWADFIIFVNGFIFLTLEVVHEVMQYVKLGHYDFSSFPFQFCTMPLFLGLLIPFLKDDKKRMPFVYFLSTFCFISGFIPLFLGQPQLCRWDSISLVIRSFEWHLQILGLALFLIGYYKIGTNWKVERKYFMQSVFVFLSITVIAQLLNTGLHYYGGQYFETPYNPELGMAVKSTAQINYADPDSASLFFISPFFRSNMVVFADLWVFCGWFISYVLYVIAFTLGAFGVLGLFFLDRNVCKKITLNIRNKKLAKAK